MRRTAWLLIVIITTIIATGCWDNLDLERRALVLGTAIDLAPKGEGQRKDDQVEVTMEMPILRLMAAKGGGGGGGRNGAAKELPTWRLTLSGLTVDEAISKAATRAERRLFLGHQKVIIMGEELARRQKITEVLDFWPRHSEGYLATTILLSAGPARDLLAAQPKFAQSVSMFLYEQSERQFRTSRFVKHNLADIIAAVAAGRDILISQAALVPGQGAPELQVSGTGIIKGGKLVGWLNPTETQAAAWITGEFKGGDILALSVPELARMISLKLYKLDTNVRPQFAGDRLSMAVNLDIQADITEKIGGPSALKAQELQQVEERAGMEIKQRIQQLVTKLQQEYQADTLGFGRKIEQRDPRRWESIKDNWRQVFTQMPVVVEVKVSIRHVGMVS